MIKATDIYEFDWFWCVDVQYGDGSSNRSSDRVGDKEVEFVTKWMTEKLGIEPSPYGDVDGCIYNWGITFERHEDALVFYIAFK